jgi:hypothetical protein
VLKGHATVQVQDGLILIADTDGRELKVELKQRRDSGGRGNTEPIEAKR